MIAKFPAIQVIYLFESHASDTPKIDSDVDIAVFSDECETPTMDLELGDLPATAAQPASGFGNSLWAVPFGLLWS